MDVRNSSGIFYSSIYFLLLEWNVAPRFSLLVALSLLCDYLRWIAALFGVILFGKCWTTGYCLSLISLLHPVVLWTNYPFTLTIFSKRFVLFSLSKKENYSRSTHSKTKIIFLLTNFTPYITLSTPSKNIAEMTIPEFRTRAFVNSSSRFGSLARDPRLQDLARGYRRLMRQLGTFLGWLSLPVVMCGRRLGLSNRYRPLTVIRIKPLISATCNFWGRFWGMESFWRGRGGRVG